jgi:hypothetical protein
MLTGRVPGTDLVIGLSRRLFAACRDLATWEAQLAHEVNSDLPLLQDFLAREMTDREIDERREERDVRYRERERRVRPFLAATVRRGFETGRMTSWNNLASGDIPLDVEPVGLLEAATEDTYLALDIASTRAVE